MRVVMGICEWITVMDFARLSRGTPREIQDNESAIEAYLGNRRERARFMTLLTVENLHIVWCHQCRSGISFNINEGDRHLIGANGAGRE